MQRVGIGQDSHRFCSQGTSKLCVIGGIVFESEPGFAANSDGDVVLHAICNAITSLTGVYILGGIADELCEQDGITDSRLYLEEALKTLGKQKIIHLAITIEAQRPKMKKRLDAMRKNIAMIMNLNVKQVGITVTSGEGLTNFGCGDGVQCICIITTQEDTLD